MKIVKERLRNYTLYMPYVQKTICIYSYKTFRTLRKTNVNPDENTTVIGWTYTII